MVSYDLAGSPSSLHLVSYKGQVYLEKVGINSGAIFVGKQLIKQQRLVGSNHPLKPETPLMDWIHNQTEAD